MSKTRRLARSVRPGGAYLPHEARANFRAYLADGPAGDRPPFYATRRDDTTEG